MPAKQVSSEVKKEAVNEIWLVVDGRPRAKQRPRFGKNQVYTPKATVVQESKIALAYRSVYHRHQFERGVPLRMVVDTYLGIPRSVSKRDREKMIAGEIRPVKRVLDADNALKLVADALNGVAYYDDAHSEDQNR